jgi:hypothetical protein
MFAVEGHTRMKMRQGTFADERSCDSGRIDRREGAPTSAAECTTRVGMGGQDRD